MTRTVADGRAAPIDVTGANGVVAIDKVGNRVLFLDPLTLRTEEVLQGFSPRVHEVIVSLDRRRAYVPIYGDGIHGNNPRPGNQVAVIDLLERRHVADISTAPYVAPHGVRWGANGRLLCLCEDSGVVLEIDPATGSTEHVIPVGSTNAHRMVVLPDGTKLYTENEEDAFGSVVDLTKRRLTRKIPLANGSAGIAMSPDGGRVVFVDAGRPQLLIADTTTDEIVRVVRLSGHDKPAQIARFSPSGHHLVVTSHDAPLCSIFDTTLDSQHLVRLQEGPMDMAFDPAGRSVIIANQDAGTLSVVGLERAEVSRTVQALVGVEALSFF